MVVVLFTNVKIFPHNEHTVLDLSTEPGFVLRYSKYFQTILPCFLPLRVSTDTSNPSDVAIAHVFLAKTM